MKESQFDTCVIGAGPAGLAVARALAERNLPYTQLERHTGPGGIWDIDNPGSPMYESAHQRRSDAAGTAEAGPQAVRDPPGHQLDAHPPPPAR